MGHSSRCCPYSHRAPVAVPSRPVTLSLGSFSLSHLPAVLEPLFRAVVRPKCLLSSLRTPTRWTAPPSPPQSSPGCFLRTHTGRAQSCTASAGQRPVCLMGAGGEFWSLWGPGRTWTWSYRGGGTHSRRWWTLATGLLLELNPSPACFVLSFPRNNLTKGKIFCVCFAARNGQCAL